MTLTTTARGAAEAGCVAGLGLATAGAIAEVAVAGPRGPRDGTPAEHLRGDTQWSPQ